MKCSEVFRTKITTPEENNKEEVEKMTKVIEKKKMSKKAQREENNISRKTWDMCPVSRVVKDKTKYTRKKKHKTVYC